MRINELKPNIMNALVDAHNDIARRGYEILLELSSGVYKTHELIRPPWSFPYSLAGGRPFSQLPYGTPHVVNEQTGAFKRGWRQPQPAGAYAGGDEVETVMENTDSKADKLWRGQVSWRNASGQYPRRPPVLAAEKLDDESGRIFIESMLRNPRLSS